MTIYHVDTCNSAAERADAEQLLAQAVKALQAWKETDEWWISDRAHDACHEQSRKAKALRDAVLDAHLKADTRQPRDGAK